MLSLYIEDTAAEQNVLYLSSLHTAPKLLYIVYFS